MTIRERIQGIQKSLRDEAVSPVMAREALLQLTALLGNVNDEVRAAEHDYKLVLLGCLQGDEAAARAKIRAEVTPQYERMREAKDTADLVLEMIRSAKVFIRSQDEEARLSR